jgi:signal transduction histidine kinase
LSPFFAAAARHAGAQIDISVPVSLFGTWDRLAMEQIIDNLISNAIKWRAPTDRDLCRGSRE